MDNFDMFAMDDSQMQIKKKGGNKFTYSPNLSNADDKVYLAKGYFLPHPKDPYNKSVRTKTAFWINCPELGLKTYVDGQEDFRDKCPLNELFWELFNLKKKGDVVADKKLKQFSRKTQYHSLFLVEKDKQLGESVEGEIKALKYNRPIHKLILAQLEPTDAGESEFFEEDDEDEVDTDPCNVFNVMKTKKLHIKIVEKGGYPNYDECKFSQKRGPLVYNGKPLTDKKTRKEFLEKYKEAADKIDEYVAEEWDEELEAKIMKFIALMRGKSVTSIDDFMDDDDDDEDGEEEVFKSKTKKASKTKSKQNKKSETIDEDDDDETFNDDDDDEFSEDFLDEDDDDETFNDDDDDDIDFDAWANEE